MNKELEIEKSKKWIKDLINQWLEITKPTNGEDEYSYRREKFTYEDIMNHADQWVNSDNPDRFPVGYMWGELPDEFWHHYEIIRGKKVKKDKKQDFLACCC